MISPVPPLTWIAVLAPVAVEANAPLTVTLAKVGPQAVQMAWGRENVTPPVDPDTSTSLVVPATEVTPVLAMVRPETLIPVPATKEIAPVLPSNESTPVLEIVMMLVPPLPTPIPDPDAERVIAGPVWELMLVSPPDAAKSTVAHTFDTEFQYQYWLPPLKASPP
jgi:hypothetical protein